MELSTLVANVAALLLLIYMLPRFGIQAAAWAVVFNNSLKLFLLLRKKLSGIVWLETGKR